MRCTIWCQPTEHMAESLRRGDRVLVAGRLRQRSFETSDGDKRTVVELDVDEVGPSLRYATVKLKVVATEWRPDGGRPSDDDEPPFSQHWSRRPGWSGPHWQIGRAVP